MKIVYTDCMVETFENGRIDAVEVEKRSSPLKCERELVPTIAGECRAAPVSIQIGKNMVRSASAEVLDDCFWRWINFA